jgi:hypothetical protein
VFGVLSTCFVHLTIAGSLKKVITLRSISERSILLGANSFAIYYLNILAYMFLFIAGHSWGSSSWIWKIMKENGVYVSSSQESVILAWSIVVIYFVLIALFATYSLRLYFKHNQEKAI